MSQKIIAKRDEYYIKDLEAQDRFLLNKWAEFEDPIFYGYNYVDMSDKELSYWYSTKQYPFRVSYFSVMDYDGNMIGYLGIKEINRFTKAAKLGIVLDPRHVSKGYGTLIMKDFLAYYFDELNMKRLNLEVNGWNKRAINLYKKFGFKYYGEYMQKFENQTLDIYSDEYSDVREFFEEKTLGLYNKIYKMSMTKLEYEEGKDEI